METKDIKELLNLMTCVCCCEIDGSMCEEYRHQVNERLSQYPEEIRDWFIDSWIIVSVCAHRNKQQFDSSMTSTK